MAKLFLGVRIPNRAYERLLIEDVDFEQSVLGLRDQIAKKLDVPKEEIGNAQINIFLYTWFRFPIMLSNHTVLVL